jgi:hypothetical protein
MTQMTMRGPAATSSLRCDYRNRCIWPSKGCILVTEQHAMLVALLLPCCMTCSVHLNILLLPLRLPMLPLMPLLPPLQLMPIPPPCFWVFLVYT